MKLHTLFKKEKVRGFEILNSHSIYFGFGSGYEKLLKPARKTHNSAGYDISAIGDYTIEPGCKAIIPTGITAYMPSNEWLALYVRSGLAYEKDLTLQNATGVIDADFYGNQIKILLRNEGTETYVVKHGDRIAQGIFLPFLKADDDAATLKQKRAYGFGSTGEGVA